MTGPLAAAVPAFPATTTTTTATTSAGFGSGVERQALLRRRRSEPPASASSSAASPFAGSVFAPAAAAAVPAFPTPSTVAGPSAAVLCGACVQNQTIVMHLLAAYDPDDDEFFDETAAAYRAHVEALYPSPCAACAPRVAAQLRAADRRARSRLLDAHLGAAAFAPFGRAAAVGARPSRVAALLAGMAVVAAGAAVAAQIAVHVVGVFAPVEASRLACELDGEPERARWVCFALDLWRAWLWAIPYFLVATAPTVFVNPLAPWRPASPVVFGRWRVRVAKTPYLLGQGLLLSLRIAAYAVMTTVPKDPLMFGLLHLAFQVLCATALIYTATAFSFVENSRPRRPFRRPEEPSGIWSFSPPRGKPRSQTASASSSPPKAGGVSSALGFPDDSLDDIDVVGAFCPDVGGLRSRALLR
ncbi:hypothetical protein HK405_012562, partial [Cladochytrium tenue]